MVATLVQNSSGFRPMLIVGGLVVGLAMLLYLTRVSWVQNAIDSVIKRTLESTSLVKVMDYELLLRIQHGYVVLEVDILTDSPWVDKALRETRPWDHGIIVLAIKTDGRALDGLPNADTVLRAGDVITVYGKEQNIHSLLDSAVRIV
jgi:Trk K+ transport system NAD-binding subunit